MELKRVYYVICPELGWDNVVDIFDADVVSYEALLEEYPEDQYMVQDKSLKVKI